MPTRATADARTFPRWLPAAILVTAVVLAFANGVDTPFLFDDAPAVVNNPTIRKLWSLAPFNPPSDGSTTTGRPLVNFSFALNYAMSGEQPWSYHAFNLACHALAALSLFGLARRALSSLNHPQPTAAAFATGLLWAIHPLQTESVTSVAQRTEVLCGLLYLLTLYAFARATEPGTKRSADSGRGWLTISAISCLLGMATKEVMVTAPIVVLLYDRTFVAGSFSAAWLRHRRYYLSLAGTWVLVGILLLRSGGSRGSSAGFGAGVSAWHYLLTQADALVLYLRLSVWPHPLVLDYGSAVIQTPLAVWWQGGFVLALLAATLWALARKPALGFAGAWFFLILAPSSSFVPLVTQTIAEHRMYLPLAAILALAVTGAHRCLGSRTTPCLMLAAIPLAGVTAIRNRDFRSAEAMWRNNIAHRPHARALTALGVSLLHSGRAAEALPLFERAAAAEPAHLAAQRNRALALLQLRRTDEAAKIFTSLPAREPGEAQLILRVGQRLRARGEIRRGRRRLRPDDRPRAQPRRRPRQSRERPSDPRPRRRGDHRVRDSPAT
jgi:hypothetical protein